MYRQITEAGVEEGIPFAFGRIERAPNTLDAHRVIRWATTTGHQHGVVEALFAAYFLEGRDIGKSETLAEIAGAAGMDRQVVARLLAGDADRQAVEDESRIAQEMGIAGVPCFIFGRKYAVSGAQTPDILAEAMRQAQLALIEENQGT
jgi:predicted DsbA family dithiol-disulfide isomerase